MNCRKAFILAAGNGTRLRPLTNRMPKCLVPVKGRPILQIWLDICARCGIEEVTVNVHAHADAVRQYLDRVPPPVAVRLFQEPVLLGSAGTLAANRGWVAAEKEFWVFYGDVITTMDMESMLRFHREANQIATLAVSEVLHPESCGIARIDDAGTVTEFVEKPEHPMGNLGFAGVMIGSPEILEFIPSERPADIGFHLLPQLAGRMAAYTVRDYLLDVGSLESYEKAQMTWPGLSALTSQCSLSSSGSGGEAC